MNKRAYPLVYKLLAMIFIVADIYVLFVSSVIDKLYCVVIFFILVNELVTSEDDYCEHNDMFIIIDAVMFLAFGLMILSIWSQEDLKYVIFWSLSGLVNVLYFAWNIILKRTNAETKSFSKRLKFYNWLDIISAVISMLVAVIALPKFGINKWWLIGGFISWLTILGLWAKDNFFNNPKHIFKDLALLLYEPSDKKWYKISDIALNEDGTIESMKKTFQTDMQVREIEDEIDFFVLPGFIDTHMHLTENPYSASPIIKGRSFDELYEVYKRNIKEAISVGITCMCDVGGEGFNSFFLQQHYSRTEEVVPHIFTTACFFSKQCGHFMSHGGLVLNDEHDAIKYADYLSHLGIIHAKIMLGNFEFDAESVKSLMKQREFSKEFVSFIFKYDIDNLPSVEQLSEFSYTIDDVSRLFAHSEYREFVNILKEYYDKSDIDFPNLIEKLNKVKTYSQDELFKINKVFMDSGILLYAHAYEESDVLCAIDAGIKFIEHPGEYSDQLLDIIKEKDITITSTLVAAADGVLVQNDQNSISPGCTSTVMDKWYDDIKTVLPKMFDRGIRVSIGTDSGLYGTPCNSLIREIAALSDLGICMENILHAIYCNSISKISQSGQMSAKFGKINDGCFADFVMYKKNFLRGNQTGNMEILKNPERVYIKGKLAYERNCD